MPLFNRVPQLVDAASIDPNDPKMIVLPRAVADELVIASTLVPLMTAEVSAPWHESIFCSDASQSRGAYCSANVGEVVNEVVWKASRSKDGYSRLMSPVEVALRRAKVLEEVHIMRDVFEQEGPSPQRPLAFRFDIFEVSAEEVQR